MCHCASITLWFIYNIIVGPTTFSLDRVFCRRTFTSYALELNNVSIRRRRRPITLKCNRSCCQPFYVRGWEWATEEVEHFSLAPPSITGYQSALIVVMIVTTPLSRFESSSSVGNSSVELLRVACTTQETNDFLFFEYIRRARLMFKELLGHGYGLGHILHALHGWVVRQGACIILDANSILWVMWIISI